MTGIVLEPIQVQYSDRDCFRTYTGTIQWHGVLEPIQVQYSDRDCFRTYTGTIQ